jgi:hypothetical protein
MFKKCKIEKMRRAAGATPDANGRAVDFDHLGRRKRRARTSSVRNALPRWRCPYGGGRIAAR